MREIERENLKAREELEQERKMRSTRWSGMQSGHSHIDQDQKISIATSVFSPPAAVA